MNALRNLIVGLLLLAVTSCMGVQERAVGDWHGTIETPRGSLAIVVRIAGGAAALTGTMESIDQAPGELIPLSITEARPDRLAFTAPSIKGAFVGTWNASAGGWQGTWSQSGYKFALTLLPGPGTQAVSGLDGTWRAQVQRGDSVRRLVLRIATTGQSTSIKFDAPDAFAIDLAVTAFARTGTHIHFAVPEAGATFDGELSADGASMTGTWSFPNQPPTQVVFARGVTAPRVEARSRPQTPVPPFPYTVETVQIAATGALLACSLTRPGGPGPFPAAVLVTGSGGQDRDETINGHKPFAVLADHLTHKGVIVLRCDDRGVAASTGTFGSATSLDFASDASAAVAFLAQRRDVNPNAIGLIGHSEGGLVSMISASTDQRVRFLVLLASPGTEMRRMLLSQHRLLGLAQGRSESDIARSQSVLAQVLNAVAASDSDAQALERVNAILTPQAMAALGVPAANRAVFAQPMTNVWMRQLLRLDPARFLAKIRVPVLALDGSLDLLVAPEENLAAIKAGLPANADLTERNFEGLNHFFQTAKTGSPVEFSEIDETMSPVALNAVSDWIVKRYAR